MYFSKIKNYAANLSPLKFVALWIGWIVLPFVFTSLVLQLGNLADSSFAAYLQNNPYSIAAILFRIIFFIPILLWVALLIFLIIVTSIQRNIYLATLPPQKRARDSLICKTCHSIGKPQKGAKGSILIEIILWCFMLVPGLIYTLWRNANRYRKCQVCGSTELLPIDSPMGRKLTSEITIS